jgi:putative ABC transport system permease protein
MKLRALLTIAGVVIAIATFVALLSFAAGNQKFVTDAYQEMGLFTSMNVYEKDKPNDNDTAMVVPLNNEAVQKLSEIPGVVLAYPFIDFDVTVSIVDTQLTVKARSISNEALRTGRLKKLVGGYTFTTDTARECIVTHEFLEKVGKDDPDSLLGREMVIEARAISLDSALINVIDDRQSRIWDRLQDIVFDSLFNPNYRRLVMRRELNESVRRFIDGIMNRQVTVAETLIVKGVGEDLGPYRFRMAPVVIPVATARKLSAGGFGLGTDPTDLLALMRKGELFSSADSDENRNYPRITLETDPYVSHKEIIDSVEALGFEAFSFAQQFEKIQQFFMYYNLALGVIGLIALVTAALGIVNTMIMSITERRREIGILKSLGGDEREIKKMFLIESGIIGLAGSVIGIICGWVATRILAFIARRVMENMDMPVYDPFALPIWLILLAVAFGLIISLLAGYYPSSRAARIDPVEALRNE